MSVDAGVDLRAPAFEVFIFVAGVCVKDTGQLDFELDGAVQVEDPVDTVLIVSCS